MAGIFTASVWVLSANSWTIYASRALLGSAVTAEVAPRNRYSLLSLTEDSTGPSRGGLASATVRDSDDERRSVDLDDKQVSRKQLLAAIENVGAELRAIREQQVVLSNSVTFCSDKVSDFEEKLNKIDDWMRATDKILKENTKLKTDMENLESKVNDLDQAGRLNNVEIQGIPEQTNENLNNVIQKISTYINYDLKPEKIEYVHRVQLNKNSNNKTKNIILRFASRYEKENFLAAAKQKRLRKENGSSKMRIPGISDNFFVNEHLTMFNKILYKETRTAAKNKGYKHSWTKNGKIFVRKDDASRIVHVNNAKLLEKL